jgi:small subunit ribosomal protein S1
MNTVQKLLQKQEFLPRHYRRGEIATGKVIKKSETELLLDIGAKAEGLITRDEYEGNWKNLSLGDEILARVLQVRGSSGLVILSVKQASGERQWRQLQDIYQSGEIFEVEVLDYNEGGLLVSLPREGEGFLPLSHLDWSRFPGNDTHRAEGSKSGKEAILSGLVGETLLVKIIEITPEEERVVVSEKEAVSEDNKETERSFWENLEKGQKREGVVTGIVPFGLFVRLKGSNIEGLVHVSEISWSKVSDPGELFEIGDPVEVGVMDFDSQGERISLSIKALKENPWDNLGNKYSEGDKVTGTVSFVTAY